MPISHSFMLAGSWKWLGDYAYSKLKKKKKPKHRTVTITISQTRYTEYPYDLLVKLAAMLTTLNYGAYDLFAKNRLACDLLAITNTEGVAYDPWRKMGKTAAVMGCRDVNCIACMWNGSNRIRIKQRWFEAISRHVLSLDLLSILVGCKVIRSQL